jgi:hypothetical protein
MRTLLLMALFAAFTPFMRAQRMVSAPAHFTPGHNRGAHPRSFFYPLAFSDPFYSDYFPNTGSSAVPQSPVIVVQTSPATAPVPERAPSQPLMIELQGGRYVRVSGEEASETGSGTESVTTEIDPISNPSPGRERLASPAIHAVAAKELAATVLIFGDGHQEKVLDYVIADGVLYAHSDYYANGSWTRKIELSALNLPETARSNQSRGLPFQLPASPNEVIVGP